MTALITKSQEYWEADQEQIIRWQNLYPTVDIHQELNAMAGWLEGNPQRRKTLKGMTRFCNSWLQRASEKGGSPEVQQRKAERAAKGIKSTRDMTNEEMFSRDWAT